MECPTVAVPAIPAVPPGEVTPTRIMISISGQTPVSKCRSAFIMVEFRRDNMLELAQQRSVSLVLAVAASHASRCTVLVT